MNKTNISHISHISHNSQNNIGVNEANFNKKQFWAYQRLYEKGSKHKFTNKNRKINEN
jgi:hypothetical protein